MGCCFGTDKDQSNDYDTSHETRNLLRSENGEINGYRSFENGMQTIVGDEQSAYNAILQDTANDVIDVSTMHTSNIEYAELIERENQYKQKLNLSLSGNIQKVRNLIPGVSDPYAVLCFPLPSSSDMTLIQQAALTANIAVSDISVQHKDNLVVPFTT